MGKISYNASHKYFQKIIALSAKGVTHLVLGQVFPDQSGVTVDPGSAQTLARR
jgi:hypothetical protein